MRFLLQAAWIQAQVLEVEKTEYVSRSATTLRRHTDAEEFEDQLHETRRFLSLAGEGDLCLTE